MMNGHPGPAGRALRTIGLAGAAFGLVGLATSADAHEPVSPISEERLPIDFDLVEVDAQQAEALQMLALQDVSALEPSADTIQMEQSGPQNASSHISFGRQMGSIKWEIGLAAAWMTGTNIAKVSKEGADGFRFKDEGWFGDDTTNLGIDKLAHAWNSYWITDAIAARIRHKTGADNAALPAAAVGMSLMLYSEMWDAFKKSSGFSVQDLTMNAAGAGFSVLRNTVPGLKEKLDFRLLLIPNSDIYTPTGVRHFRQMRYLFALKLAGFRGTEDSPFRFVELHAGYRATGFTPAEERRGEPRKQRPFVGIGLNLNELFFRNAQGWAGKSANVALQYLQVPYTAYHAEVE